MWLPLNGIWIGKQGGGTNWSSYWTNQLTPVITAQYYWWDNISAGNTRRLKIVHAYDAYNGMQYFINKNTDSSWWITDISKVDLVEKKVGEVQAGILDWTNTARFERVSFTGTGVGIRIAKGNSSGIMRAILFDGTLRFAASTGNNAAVVADAQEGYYYIVRVAGDYTGVNAALGTCGLRDIIHYSGGAWHKYTEAQYTYIDIDCYSASSVTAYYTLFSGLPLGTYKVGCTSINQKNESSSGVLCFPTVGTGLVLRLFRIIGGTPNSTDNGVSLNNALNINWEMSISIKKNGTAQTSGWIPEHNNSGTQLNYHTGEDVAYDADGTAITGWNTGDKVLTAVTEFTLTNIAYAVNAGAVDELLKVTTVMTFTTVGINISNTYETLVATDVATAYSFMLPWSTAVLNQFVSDIREEITLPEDQTNVTDGANRKGMFVYNDTVSGDYENLILMINIPDPVTTNAGSELTSFLSNYGTTYGKLYLLALQGVTWQIGHTWTTSINIIAGNVDGLIAKIDTYVGS